jgi:hypothetical protein
MPFSRIPASPVDKNIIVVTNAQPVERERWKLLLLLALLTFLPSSLLAFPKFFPQMDPSSLAACIPSISLSLVHDTPNSERYPFTFGTAKWENNGSEAWSPVRKRTSLIPHYT